MKVLFIILTVVIGASFVLLLILGRYSQKVQAPSLLNGSLLRCPDKPNCVCSEFIDDVDHYIEPVKIRQELKIDAMPKVVSIIKEMDGIIQKATDNYIAATFKSSIFGFVDDLEIRIDPIHGVMHFRSASRVGYKDWNVNRKRVELFKMLYSINNIGDQ